jgi:hypothetical protein
MLLTLALQSALRYYSLQDWDSAFGLGSALMRDAEALQLPLPSAGATPSAAAQALRTQAARLRELEEQAAELRHSRDSAAAGARAALVSAASAAAVLPIISRKHAQFHLEIFNISHVGDSSPCENSAISNVFYVTDAVDQSSAALEGSASYHCSFSVYARYRMCYCVLVLTVQHLSYIHYNALRTASRLHRQQQALAAARMPAEAVQQPHVCRAKSMPKPLLLCVSSMILHCSR